MLLPSAYLVYRVSGDLAGSWDVITSESVLRSLIRTAGLAAAVTAASIALTVPLAWLTSSTDLPFRRVWAVLLALPLVFPSYVGAFAMVAALGPRGMLQDLLAPLGVERLPEIYGFEGAVLVLTLFTFPYVFLPARTAFQGVDGSMLDAARGLGSGSVATFVRIALPQVRPALIGGGLLVCLYTLSDFGAVSILRFDSLTRVVYLNYTAALDRTAAAAAALVLVALALAIVALEQAVRGRARYHARGVRTAPRVVHLRGWTWPALAFCALVVAVSLVMPFAVIVYWLVRGLDAGQTVDFVWEAAFNSAYASSLAAVFALAAALPLAYLSVRRGGWVSDLLERVTYAGFAIPGITVALALVFFAARYTPWVYQTLSLLVFAYVVRFLPQALSACRSSLVQVNPNTEEAARGLGRSVPYVFARVTAPQMAGGLWAGGVLVFLTAMKELPATLLLSPLGFDTLSTEIWSATTEALFSRAAVPALILVLVSIIPMTLLVARERSEL
jgi:iron(III) transport system permease protein